MGTKDVLWSEFIVPRANMICPYPFRLSAFTYMHIHVAGEDNSGCTLSRVGLCSGHSLSAEGVI